MDRQLVSACQEDHQSERKGGDTEYLVEVLLGREFGILLLEDAVGHLSPYGRSKDKDQDQDLRSASYDHSQEPEDRPMQEFTCYEAKPGLL